VTLRHRDAQETHFALISDQVCTPTWSCISIHNLVLFY
jgi:hypothetical protein